MTQPSRTRAPQASLSATHKDALDSSLRALARAVEAVEEARGALNEDAGRIAEECGRGGASAVARYVGWSAQHVSTLAAAHRGKTSEGSAAA
ncbi:hypothetical protein [Streptomyces sp. NPDC055189]